MERLYNIDKREDKTMEKESKFLEYKEQITKTYLKTVSAFANYNDGEIIFGVTDDFNIIGVENPNDACLNIENQINDSIKPLPNYSLRINKDNTISLFVKKGFNTPYRYNGKCYIRNDSSTIEADDLAEKRLILEGMNLNYEDLPCKKDELSFEILSKKIVEALNLSKFDKDVLKSLNLYSDTNGYNNAAYLLSDNNNFLGLDIVVFGNNINEFRRRYTFDNVSILKQYYDAIDIYKNEYTIEKIEGSLRVKHELIPFEAFREAIANALVHRAWDVRANIKVEMHPDKVRISSPGGLVAGMSNEDYINGNYSSLRNPIIAEVFHRLNIIEKFATGIKRINSAYLDKIVKPTFLITSGAIAITLPVVNAINLTSNEQKIYDVLKQNYSYQRNEIESLSGMEKSTVIRILNSLIEKGLVEKEGSAKATVYRKVASN
jgi:ATP-dependent DNA helicase RecG